MPHVLLTSRDTALADAVRSILPEARIDVLGRDVPEFADPDTWCFVDWLPEDTSGLEICRRLRASPATRRSHITMVLDAAGERSRARALEAGADDYMPGPLTANSLAERLRAYLGEHAEANGSTRYGNGFELDSTAHQARWQGRVIPLRPREMRLLQLFLARPDHLLTRTRIIALLGKDSEIGDERTVDKWVGCLRRTLDQHGAGGLLRTVRSLGYVFDSPN